MLPLFDQRAELDSSGPIFWLSIKARLQLWFIFGFHSMNSENGLKSGKRSEFKLALCALVGASFFALVAISCRESSGLPDVV